MSESIHQQKTSPKIAKSIAELLRALHQARRRGDFFREAFQQALHVLHHQHVRIRAQDTRIAQLCDELRDTRRPAA